MQDRVNFLLYSKNGCQPHLMAVHLQLGSLQVEEGAPSLHPCQLAVTTQD